MKKILGLFSILLLVASCGGYQKNEKSSEVFLFSKNAFVSIKKENNSYKVGLQSRNDLDYLGMGVLGFGDNQILLREEKAILYVSDFQIIQEDLLNHSRKPILRLDQFKSKEFQVQFLLSEPSPDRKKIILFADRRENSSGSESDVGCGDGGPPMLYPNQDQKSGFYLLDLETKRLSKLGISGEFLGWASNSVILISDLRYIASPNYYAFNLETNNLLRKVELPTNLTVIDNVSSDKLTVGYGHPKQFQAQFGVMNKITYDITPLSDWFTARAGSSPKISVYDNKIYSFSSYSTREMKNYWRNSLYSNGNLCFEFKLDSQIQDYNFLSSTEVAFISSEKKVIIVNILEKRKVFEKSF